MKSTLGQSWQGEREENNAISIGWLPPGADDSIKLRDAVKRSLIRMQLLSAREAYIV